MHYTGIGSRTTPPEECERISDIATILASRGHILRSGGATGADIAFELGHKKIISENLQIYIPWPKFVNQLKPYHYYNNDKVLENTAATIASETHPAWNKCSHGAKKLHTRNVYQVLGDDLKTPSDFLIAWTSDGRATGGSATAINLALKNNIKVYNINSFELRSMTAIQVLKHISETLGKPL